MATQATTMGGIVGERVTGAWGMLKWLLPVFITFGVVAFLIYQYWDLLNAQGDTPLPYLFAIMLSAILSALPAFICIVQNASRRRQSSKLEALDDLPVAKTTLFKTARRSVGEATGSVDADYVLPAFALFLIVFTGFIAMMTAFRRTDYFEAATVLLGGLYDRSDTPKLAAYQMSTFCVISMAFIGSYIYMLGRLLDRINNNDLYPISLYYYVVRIVIACGAAAVLRHTISVFADGFDAVTARTISTDAAPLLLLIGFAIGFAPDLFIVAMSRKAFQALKIWGTRADPAESQRPISLPLLMIDDLTREKIDRLNELGIDSAQELARRNPFLLLPRVPYDLSLLVDWMGQAQLYVMVKEVRLMSLRGLYVRDIFDLHIRLEDQSAQAKVCTALDIPAADALALIKQLTDDPSYMRLRELRDALRQPA